MQNEYQLVLSRELYWLPANKIANYSPLPANICVPDLWKRLESGGTPRNQTKPSFPFDKSGIAPNSFPCRSIAMDSANGNINLQLDTGRKFEMFAAIKQSSSAYGNSPHRTV
ncbi:hypothetical protein HUJ04_013196 [Dendroctonus ponderosae]|nr:hypothetical protein HUJ04_013196 [Dendroctonus ponderosae]